MKTFSTSGTGNQQTLSVIESNSVPIYDSMADVTADLANLSVGQIVATKDTGDELAQPVNVVEAGNLHAVTSNAVASALFPDYTTNINTISSSSTAGFIAPCDCYIVWGMTVTSERHLTINGSQVGWFDLASANLGMCGFSGYIKKGDVVKDSITNSGYAVIKSFLKAYKVGA